jgi:hypothetical protein
VFFFSVVVFLVVLICLLIRYRLAYYRDLLAASSYVDYVYRFEHDKDEAKKKPTSKSEALEALGEWLWQTPDRTGTLNYKVRYKMVCFCCFCCHNGLGQYNGEYWRSLDNVLLLVASEHALFLSRRDCCGRETRRRGLLEG